MMIKNLLAQIFTSPFNRRTLVAALTVVSMLVLATTVYLMIQTLPPITVVVHRADVNGQIQTSVRQMNAENVTINGNASITGGLYIPGTPTVKLNGNPSFGGVVEGTGNPQPTNHQVTLNGNNATLGKLFNRIDSSPLPTVSDPPASTGTRDVNINNPNDQVGDFATLRDLTVNGNVPAITVPAGTYRNFTANNGGFILGVAGATQASIYNFNQLTLNGNTQLQVVGPVVVTLKQNFNFNSVVGNAGNTNFLTLKVSSGSVTLNGNASFNGTVVAPSGTVTVNGNCMFTGVVIADKLTVNGNGVVKSPSTLPRSPALTIQQPVNNSVTKNTSIAVTGTVVSDFVPIVKVNGVAATLSGNNFTANVNLVEGSNTINVVATDLFNNQSTATVSVIRDTIAPTLSVTQPNEGAFLNTQQVIVKGAVSDATVTQVTVSGIAATISSGQYMATVTLKNEGANALTVQATDAAGNQTTLTRNVIRDTISPALVINQPSNGFITKDPQVAVSGTVSDANNVTLTLNGNSVAINNGSFSTTASLTEGNNNLNFVATDIAGNTTSVSRNIIKDTTPPSVIITSPTNGAIVGTQQVTVTGTFTDITATTITVNGVAATITSNSFTATVPLTEGSNTLTLVATDAATNQTTLTRSVIRDTTPPVLTVTSPADNTTVTTPNVTVTGSFTDATTVTVMINNVAATVTGNSFTATVSLVVGSNTLTVIAKDAANNQSQVTRNITRASDDTTPPVLTVIEPFDGMITKDLTVFGIVTDTSSVMVSANDMPLTVNGTAFTGHINLTEGINQVRVVARDTAGNQSELVRTMILDSTPPAINDLNIAQNLHINANKITVQGKVNDATAVTVIVNNITLDVDASGTFIAKDIPIIEGTNLINITAIDAAENFSEIGVTVIGDDITPPTMPNVFPVNSPTRLSLQPIEGRAEPGSQITIMGGVETVTANAAYGTGLFVANVSLKNGMNSLIVTAKDAANNVSPPLQLFVVSDPNIQLPPNNQASQINIAIGDAQRGLVNMELPRPLIAIVTDKSGMPVSGVPVNFTLIYGSGKFIDGSNNTTSLTNAQGYASVRYISGNMDGIQLIRANFADNKLTQITFTAESLKISTDAVTRVSGIVVDQNLRALPNVLIRISGQETHTGQDGRFDIIGAIAGPHQLLEIIGRDQVALPGRWPNISYDFDILPGVDNNLGRPIFLPKVNDGIQLPLDANNVVTKDTTFELTIMSGVPPIKVTAKTGTHITFPPDITDKRLSVTRIATDRVPMALEDGRATNLYVSVQPSGAVFDPPLEISFPNLDQQSPNTLVLLMSFDHDAGRYVQVGTGHVSADGQTVKNDMNSGIRVGAWHGFPPPPPQQEVVVEGYIQVKDNPAFDGKVILNAEAWVESTRAVLISAPDTVEIRRDYRATVPAKRVASYKMESTVQVSPVTIAPLGIIIRGKKAKTHVTFTPAPNQSPVSIDLTLSTTKGTGKAEFAMNHSTTLTITATTDVEIEGIKESSDVDNIRLEAKISQRSVAKTDFSILWVTMSLNGSTVSSDNDGANTFMVQLGTTTLGTFKSSGRAARIWRNGVELAGTVSPKDFKGFITLRRRVIETYLYVETPMGPMPVNSKGDFDDTTANTSLRDDDPQPNGKVYDLDAPGLGNGPNAPVGNILRTRVNFFQWAEYQQEQVSDILFWFSRISVKKTTNGDDLETSVSGDNTAGVGFSSIKPDLK